MNTPPKKTLDERIYTALKAAFARGELAQRTGDVYGDKYLHDIKQAIKAELSQILADYDKAVIGEDWKQKISPDDDDKMCVTCDFGTEFEGYNIDCQCAFVNKRNEKQRQAAKEFKEGIGL